MDLDKLHQPTLFYLLFLYNKVQESTIAVRAKVFFLQLTPIVSYCSFQDCKLLESIDSVVSSGWAGNNNNRIYTKLLSVF